MDWMHSHVLFRTFRPGILYQLMNGVSKKTTLFASGIRIDPKIYDMYVVNCADDDYPTALGIEQHSPKHKDCLMIHGDAVCQMARKVEYFA